MTTLYILEEILAGVLFDIILNNRAKLQEERKCGHLLHENILLI